jgi:hypothetical protein
MTLGAINQRHVCVLLYSGNIFFPSGKYTEWMSQVSGVQNKAEVASSQELCVWKQAMHDASVTG